MSNTRVDLLAAALERHSRRYDTVMKQPLMEDITIDGQLLYRFMPAADRRKLNQWFQDRYRYLEEQYRLAINSADNIIGKQHLFDQRTRLYDRR